ncbi:MAG: hypothetical protein AAFQ60_17780, partial [Pseudomonadota bacterium]
EMPRCMQVISLSKWKSSPKNSVWKTVYRLAKVPKGAVLAQVDATHHEIHETCLIARSVYFPLDHAATYESAQIRLPRGKSFQKRFGKSLLKTFATTVVFVALSGSNS